VTINNGYVMPAWYDITGLDLGAAQDARGIAQSQKMIEAMMTQLIADGILSTRIMIFGFSQGGAIALQTGLRFNQPLAGVAALSAYLPLHQVVEKEKHPANHRLPIFMAHGLMDSVVPYTLGQQSYDYLKSLGYQPDWHAYPMDHAVCLPEIKALGEWISKILLKESSLKS
jgi:phospholipase/carboxylesterase